MKKALLLAGVALLMPIRAMALVPKLSGTYAMTYNEFCQVTLDIANGTDTDSTSSQPFVASITTVDDGKISVSTATATFTPKTGMVSLSATGGKGSILIVPGLSGPNETMAPQSFSGVAPYSTTATTFKLNGITFDAAYGMIVLGVAKYVSFTAIDPAKPACVIQGTAVHQ